MNLRVAILSLAILAIAGALAWALWVFRQQPEQEEIVPLATPVEVIAAREADVRVQVSSQGVVEAKTLTSAASEVAGKVVEVSPLFEPGRRFEEGDVLLRIHPADYEYALAEARAAVARAELNVEVERAKAEQSVRDWKKLGRGEEPSELVRREPQLASAEADLAAAQAAAAKAARDVERTELRAPYEGRILRTHTDLASFVTVGAPLADFYESGALEVRLPISLEDLAFLAPAPTPVSLSSSTGETWSGEVVRRESEVDRRSRSLHVVAAVEVPEGGEGELLLVPGLFVRAQLQGKMLENVFPLPRRALQKEDTVLVVTDDERLVARPVKVVRKESESVYVSEGLKVGERVCVSFVPAFHPGMKVDATMLSETPKAEPEGAGR